MKRILLMFTVMFTLILLGSTASAATTYTYGDLSYTVSNGEVTITDCKPEVTGKVEIPSEINGSPVTAIGEGAFYRGKMQSVIIPDSVKTIENDAFHDCGELTDITMSNSLTYLADYAFYYCEKLTDITLPDSLTYIGEYAFAHCEKLDNIDLPAHLTCLGLNALWDTAYFDDDANWENDMLYQKQYLIYVRSNLREYTIRQGTEYITEGAFRKCTEVREVRFPESVKLIGKDAFSPCEHFVQKLYDGSSYGWSQITIRQQDYEFTSARVVCDWVVIRYSGDYTGMSIVLKEHDAELPTPPEGYHYVYTKNGYAWNGKNILFDVNVVVKKEINQYTITYTGDYTDTVTVTHGSDVTLPTPPENYTYTFTVDGAAWDGKQVSSNATVTVVQKLVEHKVSYIGDYVRVDSIPKWSDAVLPTPPEGYVYRFTADGEPWDGKNITADVTVTVEQLHDRCEISDVPYCYDVTLEEEKLKASTYFGKLLPTDIAVSEGATVKFYTDAACTQENDCITVTRTDENAAVAYILVTAESGRTKTYTAEIQRTVVDALGELTFIHATGRHITLQLQNAVLGNPKLWVVVSKNGTDFTYLEADYDATTRLVQCSGLEKETTYLVKVAADYRETPNPESDLLEIQTGRSYSTECDIVKIISPSNAKYDTATGEIFASVSNAFREYQIRLEVSAGATWGLYRTASAQIPMTDGKIALEEGETTVAYIKVLAEDGYTSRTYPVRIYRQRKSKMPTIQMENGLVTMHAAEGSQILYTTDSSEPIPGISGMVYTGAFSANVGTIIKAIALEPDVEEYSDIAVYQVKAEAEVLAECLRADQKSNEISFDYYLMANDGSNLQGTFYLVAYNAEGKMIGLYCEKVEKTISEYEMKNTMTLEENAAYLQVFFWDDAMKPLRKTITQDVVTQ